MGIKFSELDLGVLDNDDVLAIVDNESGSSNSRKITGAGVSSFIFSTETLTNASNISNLRAALNQPVNLDGTGSNGLNATGLFYDPGDGSGGAYRSASYFLDYNNLTAQSKPTVPTTVNQLVNDFNFVSLNEVAGVRALRVQNTGAGSGATPASVTTDHLPAGTNPARQYFDDAVVDRKIREQFGGLFNEFSSTFDSGNTSDSLENISGVWQTEAAGTTSSVLRIDPAAKALQNTVTFNDFSVGDVVRVYGCETGSASDVNRSVEASIDNSTGISSFSTDLSSNVSGNFVTFEYRFAYFNLRTGRIGSRSVSDLTASFTLPGTGVSVQDILDQFNIDYYIKISFSNLLADHGILVYRKHASNNVDTNLKLIAVLGPKDLSTNTFTDYYNFDYNAWSGKDPTDNSYIGGPNTDVVHFPYAIVSDPGAGLHEEELKGWADLTIAKVDPIANGVFDLTFGASENNLTTVSINSANSILGRNAVLCHNDTSKINASIASKQALGIKSLALNAKTYMVSHIGLPSEFGLIGVIGITKVKKLPWASFTIPDPVGAPHQPIVRTVNQPVAVSLENIVFDGNSINQFLLGDDVGNRFIDFQLQSTDITIQNCKMQKMIGSGVFASLPVRFKMNVSEIADSALTDRFDFSPLVIDSGENTLVTGNVIRNFTESIDATVNYEGIIANNVIKNVGAGINVETNTTDGRPGAGIDIYGSTFLVTSPNVLIGPNNETLSTPDVLNSEYDSINILRSAMQVLNPGDYFTSDPFVYQENGVTLNLTEDSMGGSGQVVFRANLLRVDGSGNHNFYGSLIGPGKNDISNSPLNAPTSTSGTAVGSHLDISKVYEIDTVGDTDWTLYGASVNKVGSRFQWNGTAIPSGTTGIITAKEFPGYNDSSLTGTLGNPADTNYDSALGNGSGSIRLESITSDIDPTDGGFKFRIPHDVNNDLIDGSFTNSRLSQLYDAMVTEGYHPVGTKHYGIAWTGNLIRNVECGKIVDAGSWALGQLTADGLDSQTGLNVNGTNTIDSMNANRRYAEFTCVVSNARYFNLGDHVRVYGKTGWVAPSAIYGQVTNPYNGFVHNIGVSGDNKTVKIRYYYDASDTTTAIGDFQTNLVANEEGTLNIIDDFVMAQGLIK
jgi:hypothetical protein